MVRLVRCWAIVLICSSKHFSLSSVACEISARTESSCAVILPPSHRLSFFTKKKWWRRRNWSSLKLLPKWSKRRRKTSADNNRLSWVIWRVWRSSTAPDDVVNKPLCPSISSDASSSFLEINNVSSKCRFHWYSHYLKKYPLLLGERYKRRWIGCSTLILQYCWYWCHLLMITWSNWEARNSPLVSVYRWKIKIT